ncbi:hypothetical protein FA15DRAFT_153368 [Coprinopsis marcescibilis]|uniref:F-box domain-containing protein n=1 Tax=Coprinopsis marcescibilis TaxID=230819 RepID=A0A5C3KVL8_COPMA|nr:hypothetical protein FA15DRAFT_153368 [Coprinopsis marcescibilis]
MHSCLRISEILSIIFQFLDRRRDHHRLVMTCKAFHEPAVRQLWETLPGLAPLLYFLVEEEGTTKKHEMFLRGSQLRLTEESIKTLTKHAAYVKVLEYPRVLDWIRPENPSGHLHSVLLRLRKEKRIPWPLFPNLRVVTIPAFPTSVAIFYPAAVITPSLRSISIFVGEDTSSSRGLDAPPGAKQWDAIASRLLEVSPNLEHFRVFQADDFGNDFGLQESNIYYNMSLSPYMRPVFRGFSTNVTQISLTPLLVGGDEILAISALPNLKCLVLPIVETHNQGLQDLKSTLAHFDFPSLKELEIIVESFRALATFLSLTHAALLQSLSLKCATIYCYPRDLLKIFEALAKPGYNHSHLRHIVVTELESETPLLEEWLSQYREYQFEIRATTLEPLTCFRGLKTLEISHCDTGEMLDEGFCRIMASWPLLKKLHLPDEDFGEGLEDEWGLTIAGVHKALQLCPLLEELKIRFNGCVEASLFTEPDTPHPSLHTWDVCSSTIKSGGSFASWTRVRYPLLKNVTFFEFFSRLLAMETIFDPEDTQTVAIYGDPCSEAMDNYPGAAVMLDRWSDVPRLLDL